MRFLLEEIGGLDVLEISRRSEVDRNTVVCMGVGRK
jgi:hypothetical protein